MTHALINDGRPFLGTSPVPEVDALGGLRRAMEGHHVVRVLRNVYRDARAPDSRDSRLSAIALLAPRDAIVADDSVAWLHGIDTSDPADRYSLAPTLVVPNGESVLKLRLVDALFPFPELQFEIVDPQIGQRFLDCAYLEALIAIEYDGQRFHTASHDRAHDEQRRRLLSDLYGWRWQIATRASLIGHDDAFEQSVGKMLGIAPAPRTW